MRILAEKSRLLYDIFMNNLFNGMATIGQLNPQIPPYKEANLANAWAGVWDAFAKTGDNMRSAISRFNGQNTNREGASPYTASAVIPN
jgi:hypothetical protein